MSRHGHYKGKRFRSLMELSFYKLLEHTGVHVDDIGYESIRIPYRLGKRTRTYLPDFVVGKNVYEIKPLKRQKGRVFEAKAAAARKWCLRNGMEYSIVGERDLVLIPMRLAKVDPDVVMMRKSKR